MCVIVFFILPSRIKFFVFDSGQFKERIMINKFFGKSFFFGKAALLGLMLLFSATLINAQTSTFAQFTQRSNSQDYAFLNNTSSGTFGTVNNGSAISFTFLGVSGLPTALQGPQNATLTLSSTTTAPASASVGTRVVQPFNSTFTIRITRDTPFNGRSNLLTAVVTPVGGSNPELSGDAGATSAGFTASTPVQNVVFTSDFISFSGSTNRNLGLTFTSVTPVYTLGGSFVNSFTAAGAGSFAANQAPVFFLTPTAATVSVSGRVLSTKGRGLANARVTLTNSAGEAVTTMTDNFGNYQFADIIAGDTVIISVKSRLYEYATQVLNLSEETNGLNFTPQYAKERIR
jgi:Carboxypeptidase regulatory-like domain